MFYYSPLAQASTGKQGVLGPTKIYLAVQPSQPVEGVAPTEISPSVTQTQQASSQPPPLAPVQPVTPTVATAQVRTVVQTTPSTTGTPKPTAKVVVQPANSTTQVF